MPLQKENKHYTYADYSTWGEDFRCELIDGIIYVDGKPYHGSPGKAVMMSPAPAWIHQVISSRLHGEIYNFLKGKPCQVFHAPFDVRLNADKEDDTIIQPDIVVICDRSKLSGTGCKGVPDMIIEILSPTSISRDRVLKFNKYLQAGVREYWIVDPDTKTVQVCLLENGKYVVSAYDDTAAAPVHVLEGCTINLKDIFEE